MFAQDASFTKVAEAPEGRTYVLKFLSSNERHFVSVYEITSRDYFISLSPFSFGSK